MVAATGIDKMDPGCPLLCHTGVQRANLGVDLGEESKTGPPTNFHNSQVVDAL